MIDDKTARCILKPGEKQTSFKCNDCARPYIQFQPKRPWQYAPIVGDVCPSFLEKQA
jgi:hypothetical protein